MLIECGPTPLLRRGIDWQVNTTGGQQPCRYVFVFFNRYSQYGSQQSRRIANVAARACGFVVATDGRILNWDAVPHLWEHRNAD